MFLQVWFDGVHPGLISNANVMEKIVPFPGNENEMHVEILPKFAKFAFPRGHVDIWCSEKKRTELHRGSRD